MIEVVGAAVRVQPHATEVRTERPLERAARLVRHRLAASTGPTDRAPDLLGPRVAVGWGHPVHGRRMGHVAAIGANRARHAIRLALVLIVGASDDELGLDQRRTQTSDGLLHPPIPRSALELEEGIDDVVDRTDPDAALGSSA